MILIEADRMPTKSTQQMTYLFQTVYGRCQTRGQDHQNPRQVPRQVRVCLFVIILHSPVCGMSSISLISPLLQIQSKKEKFKSQSL
jgi:hypothetical protein